MEIITRKVFSLCEDFNPDEGFQEMYDELSKYNTCDSYITYTANTTETLKEKDFDEDLIANRLVELGADDGEVVFIYIDY